MIGNLKKIFFYTHINIFILYITDSYQQLEPTITSCNILEPLLLRPSDKEEQNVHSKVSKCQLNINGLEDIKLEQHKVLLLKGNVHVVLSDPLCKDGNV